MTENTGREAGTETENVTENAIVKERGIVIVIENVITVNHILERDHEAERGIVNAKEIANIESEAEKKGKLTSHIIILTVTIGSTLSNSVKNLSTVTASLIAFVNHSVYACD